MKQLKLILALTILLTVNVLAQKSNPEVTNKNSWLKAGITAGLPAGHVASGRSNFTLGADLKGQLMTTNHIGIGLTTGYNHFFPKNNLKSFGSIPIGVFVRVYPAYHGFFAGVDGGYSIITGKSFVINTTDNKGGLYLRPQAGYHNYDWNIFGFYNHIFRTDIDGGNIQYAGIGFTYNIRFK